MSEPWHMDREDADLRGRGKSPEQDRWERGENDAYYMRVLKRIPPGSFISIGTHTVDGEPHTWFHITRPPWWRRLWRKVKR